MYICIFKEYGYVHVQTAFIQTVQSDIYNFIWKSGIAKVKNIIMHRKIINGGLKILHFETQVKALLLNWVKRLYNQPNANWKAIFQAFLPSIKLEDLLLSRCCIDLEQKQIPVFYKQLLMVWKQFRAYFQPQNTREVRKEVIWYNEYITRDRKSIFYKKWYDKGIVVINDIVNADGTFLSAQELKYKYD